MLINDFFFPAHSAVVLKAESVADKVEWLNKLRNVIQSKGGQVIGESGPPMRHSMSDGSLVSYPVMFIVSFPPLFFLSGVTGCHYHIPSLLFVIVGIFCFFVHSILVLKKQNISTPKVKVVGTVSWNYSNLLPFRIQSLEDLLTLKKSSGGCHKKYAAMLKLFLTALVPMSQKYFFFLNANHHIIFNC